MQRVGTAIRARSTTLPAKFERSVAENPPHRFSHSCAQYATEVINEHMGNYEPKLLPGIPDLPRALGEAGACVALVTGNLEEIGWLKMEAAGMKNCFVTGVCEREVVGPH